MVRFKMIGNDNPLAIAEVIEECNIEGFRTNPEWEEIIETPVVVEDKQPAQRKTRTPKKETVE